MRPRSTFQRAGSVTVDVMVAAAGQELTADVPEPGGGPAAVVP
jgi:hypothetical protein